MTIALKDGQSVIGSQARDLIAKHGVKLACIGLRDIGKDAEAICAMIDDEDTFTVQTYGGVYLYIPESDDAHGVTIELDLVSTVDVDDAGAHWYAVA